MNQSLALKFTICLLVAGSFASHVHSQNVEEIRKRYPGENAVVLDKVLHYKMLVKDGQPYVESKESQKLLYLTTNPSYLGRYSFHHSTFHELREYSAYTQTAANKKIKVTDFQTSHSISGSVFYDDTKETKFDFPSVASGATGNLELSVVHTKPYLLSPFYFSRYIPVIRSELKISFSNDIGLKYLLKGIDTSMIKVKKEQRKHESTYTFYVENVDPEKNYPDAPDESWYLPHVIFYIDNYKNDKGETFKYLSGVEDLYKLNSSFISEVNKVPGSDLTRLVDSLTAGTPGKLEKTKLIYQWVQSHIKYIAFEDGMGGFIPRDANLVLHRRYGDCKDMASLLTMMLNAAGVPAYYTWIGTRDIAYSYYETPLPIVDNHMICAAFPEGNPVFLDGTDPNCVFGSVPAGIQDKEAMVAVGPGEYRIIKVPVMTKEQNRSTDSTFMELRDGGLTGTIGIDLHGYYATNMHSYLKSLSESDRQQNFKGMLRRGSNKFQLNGYSNADKGNKNHVRLTGQFSLHDYAKKIGDEWLINMNLLRFYEHEEIDYPRRKIPVKRDFHFSNTYVTELKIPEGYKASFVPEGKSYKNDVWGFELQYKATDSSVVYTLHFYNDHLMIQNDQFEQWNKVLEHLLPLYKESVILSKK